MADDSRADRLEKDFALLDALKATSTIFDFEASGDPPERYTVTFRGKGVARDSSPESEVEIVEVHKCDIRLPYSYPERGPDIRWLSPVFHPNISFSGFINLKQIGLPWEKGITLDVVVERLWDVGRFAFVDYKKSTNHSAKNWFEDESTLKLPVDNRPLRDTAAPSSSNIIAYERRPNSPVDLSKGKAESDVLFIGEDTPLPESHREQMARSDDDDILYIG